MGVRVVLRIILANAEADSLIFFTVNALKSVLVCITKYLESLDDDKSGNLDILSGIPASKRK